MTDDSPEHLAFAADLDRLRKAIGPDRLAEAEKRGIGDQQLTDAYLQAMAANDADLRRRDPSVVFWSAEPKPGWGNDGE